MHGSGRDTNTGQNFEPFSMWRERVEEGAGEEGGWRQLRLLFDTSLLTSHFNLDEPTLLLVYLP